MPFSSFKRLSCISASASSSFSRKLALQPRACHCPLFPTPRLSFSSTMSSQSGDSGATAGAVPLKHRSIVSNFIFKMDDTAPRQVALFRRSAKVRTYQHHLAPISGTIDPSDASPLAAAWRETAEETTLTPSHLTLWRAGVPYALADPSIGRAWTIHPFAWQLRSPSSTAAARIQIDWEHDAWCWYDPAAVLDDEPAFGGVPRLAESLRRVYFEHDLGERAAAVLEEGLSRLRTDYHSGARELAGFALETLRDVVREMGAGKATGRWWAEVRFVAWHLCRNGRESMGAAIASAVLGALGELEMVLDRWDGKEDVQRLEEAVALLGKCIARRADTGRLTSRAFANYLGETFPARAGTDTPLSILTLSESSTVAQALQQLVRESRFALDLRVLESRPLFEGVTLAGRIAEAAAAEKSAKLSSVTLFPDAAVALAAQGADVLVLGADRIAANGDVSNKIGSLPAVLAAIQTANIAARPKVVVLTETEKVAPPGDPRTHVVEENDPAQVSLAWEGKGVSERVRNAAVSLRRFSKADGDKAQGVEDTHKVQVVVRNVFFEWCPAELVDQYVTEAGVWTREDIAAHSERLDKEERRLFGPLADADYFGSVQD